MQNVWSILQKVCIYTQNTKGNQNTAILKPICHRKNQFQTDYHEMTYILCFIFIVNSYTYIHTHYTDFYHETSFIPEYNSNLNIFLNRFPDTILYFYN